MLSGFYLCPNPRTKVLGICKDLPGIKLKVGSLKVGQLDEFLLPSLKLTASSHLKMDGWKMNFLFGMAYFPGLC